MRTAAMIFYLEGGRGFGDDHVEGPLLARGLEERLDSRRMACGIIFVVL